MMSVEAIATVCHEANRAYCQTLHDASQLPWSTCPQWQRDSAILGVEFIRDNPDAPASASHDSWLEQKRREGWSYGEVKDPDKKQHPCFLPYEELPAEQQAKDALFGAICRALLP